MRHSQLQPQLSCSSILLIVFAIGTATTTITAPLESIQEYSWASAGASETGSTFYQPALIGFRCETVRDITSGGVSVIEANTPVALTLYGESFTTNTIVAFTTEFKPDTELDPALSKHVVDVSRATTQPPQTTTTTTIGLQTTTLLSNASDRSNSNSSTSSNNAPSSQLDHSALPQSTTLATTTKRRFAHRRKTKSKSYDCTDYNRVTSYKLTKENILSPNVAVLTVSLPELDSSKGMYYYFCIKQPPLTGYMSSSEARTFQKNNRYNNKGIDDDVDEDTLNNESLVWVHQGDEWWVTLKVEPPILSVANDCVLILLLLFLSAVTSGLNLGLMSLDMNELAVISSCGDHRERSYARTIAPLRKRGNYLLCALLLGNVMVNSTLTVILEEMTSGVVAVIGSTLAIVILGEIVPQAFCARQGLAIGARTIYLTYAFMILTFPLSYPISCLLDYVLGEEKGNVYDRERLMEFIKITGHHTQLDADEVAIISGALKLKKIKVDQIMTRIEDVFMLPIDCKLDRETIKRIIEKGYSRIPVHEFGDRKQIVALILAKDLALLDPDDHTPIANMLKYCKHPLIFIEDDVTLDVALNEFKTGKSHMAVVRQIYDDGEVDKYYEAIGVVTLEDVIEEVLQVEINDETDTLSDNRRKRRRTDAQVAHLMIDEFTSTQAAQSALAQASAPSLPISIKAATTTTDSELGLNNQSPYEITVAIPGALSKQVQTSLSDQLTSVSISGVAQSLAQTAASNGNDGGGNQMNTTTCSSNSDQSDKYRSAQQSVELFSSQRQHQPPNQQRVADGEQPQQVAGGGEAGGGVLSRAAQFLSNIMG